MDSRRTCRVSFAVWVVSENVKSCLFDHLISKQLILYSWDRLKSLEANCQKLRQDFTLFIILFKLFDTLLYIYIFILIYHYIIMVSLNRFIVTDFRLQVVRETEEALNKRPALFEVSTRMVAFSCIGLSNHAVL